MTPHRQAVILAFAVGLALAAVTGATITVISQSQGAIEHNEAEIDRLNRQLAREQVCSRTNQGPPCRALFDRLAGSISEQQRLRLGCAVLAALDTPDTRRILQVANCPVTR